MSVDNCVEIKSTPSVLVEFGRRCLECVGVPWREQLAAAFLRQSPCIDSLAFLRQSPCIDSLALKALTRTASGKESSRNTENEVTKKAWHKRLQQLIHFTGTMPDRVLTVSERASYYCRQQRTLRMSVIPGGGDSSVVRAPDS